jgi:hypothetical protein
MSEPDSFFIGWSGRLAQGTRAFIAAVIVAILAGATAAGALLGVSADDPDDGLVRIGERAAGGAPVRPLPWQADRTYRGWLVTDGYSLLHVPPDADHPRGQTLLLSGDGKRGPDTGGRSGPVELKGGLLRRGSIAMLVVEGPVTPVTDDPRLVAPQPEKLGRWRLAGEICDGKCYPGGMRPGAGLAHRACANLCLSGDIPPVLVTAAPFAGTHFVALAAPGGGSPYAILAPFVAGLVEVEGEVERRGSMLVMRVDPDRTRRR